MRSVVRGLFSRDAFCRAARAVKTQRLSSSVPGAFTRCCRINNIVPLVSLSFGRTFLLRVILGSAKAELRSSYRCSVGELKVRNWITFVGAKIETCGKIFYARRKNQNCCTVQCAKKRRQQKWRSKYGKPVLTKQAEIDLNKKRAKTARER